MNNILTGTIKTHFFTPTIKSIIKNNLNNHSKIISNSFSVMSRYQLKLQFDILALQVRIDEKDQELIYLSILVGNINGNRKTVEIGYSKTTKEYTFTDKVAPLL